MPSNREVIERYVVALPGNQEGLESLRHPDFVEDWPQSGERIRGPANARMIHEHHPGMPTGGGVVRVVGSEDRWVMTPSYTTLRIEGSGDVYTVLMRATYPPDDALWYVTSIIELRDQLVWHVTTIFGEAFEAPAWRAQWVERVEQP